MRRIVLYPMVPIITQLLNIIYTMYVYISGLNDYPLLLASFIATGLHGILNAIVFVTDPSIVQAFRKQPAQMTQVTSGQSTTEAAVLDISQQEPAVDEEEIPTRTNAAINMSTL
jgi:phosphotransferase system  glucose/maltose/N-acetylglucosamine-specific IIC component